MEKNFLQSIKLEISKNFKLVPYERIAFHKILGILKTENGMRILIRELSKEPLIRESAVNTLKTFDHQEIISVFISLLKEKISLSEKHDILDFLLNHVSEEQEKDIISFINDNISNPDCKQLVEKAFATTRMIPSGSTELFDYLSGIALNDEAEAWVRTSAIIALSTFDPLSIYEKILKLENDELNYAVYKGLYLFCEKLTGKTDSLKTEDEQIYTYNPEAEDRSIVTVRVLLGKMTHQFDEYNNMVKTAFINAMIACNHREFLIYVMKSLTSRDENLSKMILYILLANVSKLRDPDKLFRNLIALSVETKDENRIIVETFEKFFTGLDESRKNQLLRDKLYNYIVVTLETYFESYRKEFMVTDVMEKNYPENFQNIRSFVLEDLSPEIKKDIVGFLRHERNLSADRFLEALSEKKPYLDESLVRHLGHLIEVLYDSDAKAREISADRIDTIIFEKRYLRDRIIRLCEIIGRLEITNAASILVKIYNYVKKYPDPEILYNVSNTLSVLNYSYMLGELEVVLSSGDETEKERSMRFLSQFLDQRSLNILIDFLKDNYENESQIMIEIIRIILSRDLFGNISANHVFKKLIEINGNVELKSLAIQCVGKCGNEADINYLNELFYTFDSYLPKEAVVQGIGHIISYNTGFNKRHVINILQEYLKDPGIKVRLYSCSILIQLGNKGILKTVQDMMIIKNKNIQREILSIVGYLRSVEFAYFLISMLKEEYSIATDIIPVLSLLPREELLEIDHFIVNIFKKYEPPEITTGASLKIDPDSLKQIIKNLNNSRSTILLFNILNPAILLGSEKITELTMIYNTINNAVVSVITRNKGVISKLSGSTVTAHFTDTVKAIESASAIFDSFKKINLTRRLDEAIDVKMILTVENIKFINGEIINLPESTFSALSENTIENIIVMNDSAVESLDRQFSYKVLPEIIFRNCNVAVRFYELSSPVNFLSTAFQILENIRRKENERMQFQDQLDSELKRMKETHRSPSLIQYAQSMEELGKVLKRELDEVSKYIQKRATDRELINTSDRMLQNIYKRFILETSKIVIE